MTHQSIRRANSEDANALTELALRSKAHWGYDAEFIEDCRADLTITEKEISTLPFYIITENETILGFYSLAPFNDDVELVHLFIEPLSIGKGVGKRLWQHAVETAKHLGYEKMIIKSDPYAESFYLAMGAKTIGKISSSIREGRELPLMEFYLSE